VPTVAFEPEQALDRLERRRGSGGTSSRPSRPSEDPLRLFAPHEASAPQCVEPLASEVLGHIIDHTLLSTGDP
jgi:hypothetical protein